MSTTGYLSLAKTKEAGTPFLPLAAATWTPIDFGGGLLMTLSQGPCFINAQLYFEDITGSKLAIRVSRGTGDDTAQHDYIVKPGPWAISYMDIDFIQPTDKKRGIEVWSDKPCTLQTRILKVLNQAAYIASRITVETD